VKRLGVLAICLILSGCAAGMATRRADGSCEVRGVALGNAKITCESIEGGEGSAGLWATLGAAFGYLGGLL